MRTPTTTSATAFRRSTSAPTAPTRRITSTNTPKSQTSASLREEFVPQYDLDGNQTLVKTSTGIWQVTYNGENRPVGRTCGTTNIVMSFDRMGRRVSYLETVSGGAQSLATVTNDNYNFVYDGYLCVQRIHGATDVEAAVEGYYSCDAARKSPAPARR